MSFINKFLFDSDKPLYGRLAKALWIITFLGITALVLLFVSLSFTDLPSVQQLENPKSDLATQVFASDGSVLGRFYTENRVSVDFEDLSPHLINALIATEDERYYEHTGIDFRALGRAIVKNAILGNRNSGGASTISQQLARLLFTERTASSFIKRALQKPREWIIAIRLERKYTKQEIIAMYLNKFNFINGAYGIKAASEIYFGKSQDSLDVQEAAMLVGMLKNPNLFNPLRKQEAVKQRRMVVLGQMLKNNLLTEVEYDSLKQLPLGINFQRQTHIDGLAPYFRMELAKHIKEILNRQENRKANEEKYNIYQDGLKIYTTIDPKMQAIAEDVMFKAHMPQVQKDFWRTWRNLDPWVYRGRDTKTISSVEQRQAKLTQLVRESERYQDLRNKYLSSAIRAVSKDVPNLVFHMDDREVERMVLESEKKGVIANLERRKLISDKIAKNLRKGIRSQHFATLKKRWYELQDEVEKEFNKPVKMKVFAYNSKMEADTTMSPLDSVKYHSMFMQTGIVAVDPNTGYVKVWIGGINHKYFQFDHVTSERQVGSTFKPFVYSTAIAQQGFSPCFQVYDLPVEIAPGDGDFFLQESWIPQNSDGIYTGNLYTLKDGLRKSKNTVSAYLMKQLGSAEPVRDLVHLMGIDKFDKHPNGQLRLPKVPSIALGSTDLTVLEMTGAYTSFANNGVYNKPIFITKIEDKNGRSIYEELPEERQALSEEANYVMVEMLKYSGTNLGGVKSEVGGKTGTTNDYVDGWFIGVTPNLVVGTWVGGEYRWIRFRDLTFGQGSRMAKPFFREFMKRIEGDEEIALDTKARFFRPSNVSIEMDCSEYGTDVWENFDENEGFENEEGNSSTGFSEDRFADEIPLDYDLNAKGVPDTTSINRNN